MQWYVIGRDMHVLCTPSTDITSSLPIDDSSGGQEISIVNNCAVGTYDFVTDPRHPDAQYIVEGNYIAFRDKYGKDRLYTIMTVEGDEEWDVHCEDIGLDLINEDADPWDYTGSPKSIEETLAVPLNDTGWEIGINEIADRERATKFEGNTDSQLTRIGDVCGEFDCECEFVIEMQGSKVTRQVINIYKTLGNDATQQRFVDNINLISLRKSGSIEDLCTCMRCYGKEDENGNKLTISEINYDDGRYYSPTGHIRIYDREARQKWSRFRAYGYEGQSEFGGYINGTFEYDTSSDAELFNRGLAELQSRNDVKVSYEAKLYDVRADIGDTVQIADSSKTEKVYLSARVQSVTNYYTVKGQDTGVLANYKIMTPNQGSDLAQLMDELKGQVVSVQSTKVRYQVSNSGTDVPTGEWLDYLPGTQPGQYLWTRTVTTYTNGSSTTGYSVSRNGENGQDGKDGAPGKDGIIISSTAPSNPKVGQLWSTGSNQPIKRWTGSAWELYYISVQNLSVSALSAISANLGTVTAGLIQKVTSAKSLIIDLNNGEFQSVSGSDSLTIDSAKMEVAGKDPNSANRVIGVSNGSGLYGTYPSNGRSAYLTPKDSNGKVDFYIKRGSEAEIPIYDRLSKDPIVFMDYTAPVVALGSNATVTKEYTITPPSGYDAVVAIPAQTGSNQVYFYTCIMFDPNKLTVQLKNTGSAISVGPRVIMICKRK